VLTPPLYHQPDVRSEFVISIKYYYNSLTSRGAAGTLWLAPHDPQMTTEAASIGRTSVSDHRKPQLHRCAGSSALHGVHRGTQRKTDTNTYVRNKGITRTWTQHRHYPSYLFVTSGIYWVGPSELELGERRTVCKVNPQCFAWLPL